MTFPNTECKERQNEGTVRTEQEYDATVGPTENDVENNESHPTMRREDERRGVERNGNRTRQPRSEVVMPVRNDARRRTTQRAETSEHRRGRHSREERRGERELRRGANDTIPHARDDTDGREAQEYNIRHRNRHRHDQSQHNVSSRSRPQQQDTQEQQHGTRSRRNFNHSRYREQDHQNTDTGNRHEQHHSRSHRRTRREHHEDHPHNRDRQRHRSNAEQRHGREESGWASREHRYTEWQERSESGWHRLSENLRMRELMRMEKQRDDYVLYNERRRKRRNERDQREYVRHSRHGHYDGHERHH